MHRLLLLALAVAGSACRPLATATGTDSDLRAELALYDSAWAAKDLGAVDHILAPAYTYFTSQGGLSDRAATMTFLRDTSYVLTRSVRSDVQVTIVGQAARMSSRWQGNGRYQGKPVRDDQTCGQTWIILQGGWRLFTEHCVNRPNADAAITPAGADSSD